MKTTGVRDIPKFGLLVLLGHPSGHQSPPARLRLRQCKFPPLSSCAAAHSDFVQQQTPTL